MPLAMVDVANSSLAKLGSVRITTIDDATEPAKLCKQQLPYIYRELLRKHSWGFAMKRAALTLNVTPPVSRFASAFDLPADFLGVFETDLFTEDEWSLEGAQILCDEATLTVAYTWDVTDVSKWSTDFFELVATKLAHDISYSITQSTSLKQTLWDEFDKKLKDARFTDSRERSGQRVTAKKWLNSRR